MAKAGSLTEASLFRSYWQDGLLDILCGAGLLLIGLGWQIGLGPLAAPVLVVLWSPLRRRIVEPRAGFVRFCLARRQRTDRELRWTVTLGVGVLAVLTLGILWLPGGESGSLARRLVPGLPAVLLAIGASLAAVLTGARRFHAYGLVLVITAVATVLLATDPPLPLIAAGLVVATSGAGLLARFLRDSRAYEEERAAR